MFVVFFLTQNNLLFCFLDIFSPQIADNSLIYPCQIYTFSHCDCNFSTYLQTQLNKDNVITMAAAFETSTQLTFRIRYRSFASIRWSEAKQDISCIPQFDCSVSLSSLSLFLSRFLFNWKSEQPLCSGATPLALCRLISHLQVHHSIFLFTLPPALQDKKNSRCSDGRAVRSITSNIRLTSVWPLTFCVPANMHYIILKRLPFSSSFRSFQLLEPDVERRSPHCFIGILRRKQWRSLGWVNDHGLTVLIPNPKMWKATFFPQL